MLPARFHLMISLVLLSGQPSHAAENVTLIAVTGAAMQAPGTPAHTFFSGALGMPVVNHAGEVAFTAHLVGATISDANDFGIWIGGDSQSLQLVVRESAGAALRNVLSLNDSSMVSFEYIGEQRLFPGTPGYFESTDSVWRWNGAGEPPRLLAARGGGLVYIGPWCPSAGDPRPSCTRPVSNSGDTVFWAGVGSETNYRSSILRVLAGSLETVAIRDMQAPGTEEGALFTSFGAPVMSSDGDLAFVGETGVPGIWASVSSESLGLVVQAFDPAPGLPAGSYFESFTDLKVGTSELAFKAAARLPGGPSVDGIWRVRTIGANRTPVLVAREYANTDPAFIELGEFAINDAGSVVFRGETSPYDEGVWSVDANGVLSAVARINGPRVVDGKRFTSFERLAINDRGDVLFRGELETGEVGVFFRGGSSQWSWILEGESLAIAAGDTRTIRDLEIEANPRPGRMSLNHRSQAAVRATLPGEAQALVLWEPVPEPSRGAAMFTAVASMIGLRAIGASRASA